VGRLDILVNSAGVHVAQPLGEMTAANIDYSLALHVRATLLAAQAAAAHLPAGGRIITIGSAVADRVPAPGLTLYATNKAALSGLTKGLARDLGARGITVNLVQPGPTDTAMNPAAGPAAEPQRQTTALGRYADPDDIAATVAFLAGAQSHYITGATIPVDGGFTV
jgi:NAD(P)-dependent dehydrogenase (short-subunit alcohol dehydrogenase family)